MALHRMNQSRMMQHIQLMQMPYKMKNNEYAVKLLHTNLFVAN